MLVNMHYLRGLFTPVLVNWKKILFSSDLMTPSVTVTCFDRFSSDYEAVTF